MEADAAPVIKKVADKEVFSTGVAKGRDRLDSAISTNVLREAEILKFAPQSIGDLLRDIPGIRSEAFCGEGNANITLRALPLSATDAKFVQLQEDGLPIFEFGENLLETSDAFLRADINLSQVEVIRGGSASTFASNSPGGIINFQSKTGEVEGGAIQISSGLDFDQKRIDMDYGAKLRTPCVSISAASIARARGRGAPASTPRRVGSSSSTSPSSSMVAISGS